MIKNKVSSHIPILTGSTASGKSSLALRYAQQHNGVIINADAMQMYDTLPILTAQPDAVDQSQCPHALYSVLTAHDYANADIWREMAIDAIHTAYESGYKPIIVGGTGFYIKTLMDGLSPIPHIDQSIQQSYITQYKDAVENGYMGMNHPFYRDLKADNPDIDSYMHAHNTQRIIRAYMILKETGRNIQYWQSLPKSGAPEGMEFDLYALTIERSTLIENIENRFHTMLRAGALDEIYALHQKLRAGDIPTDSPVLIAHGFRPFREVILRNHEIAIDKIDFTDAITQSIIETRQYARRQMTWIRNQFCEAKDAMGLLSHSK
jgi:tRNA dimethylallyltransferase